MKTSSPAWFPKNLNYDFGLASITDDPISALMLNYYLYKTQYVEHFEKYLEQEYVESGDEYGQIFVSSSDMCELFGNKITRKIIEPRRNAMVQSGLIRIVKATNQKFPCDNSTCIVVSIKHVYTQLQNNGYGLYDLKSRDKKSYSFDDMLNELCIKRILPVEPVIEAKQAACDDSKVPCQEQREESKPDPSFHFYDYVDACVDTIIDHLSLHVKCYMQMNAEQKIDFSASLKGKNGDMCDTLRKLVGDAKDTRTIKEHGNAFTNKVIRRIDYLNARGILSNGISGEIEGVKRTMNAAFRNPKVFMSESVMSE